MNAQRMVNCVKLKEELPGLPFKPLKSELGQLIFERVSMQAWQMWLQESPRYINTAGIDLQSKDGQAFLEQQMRVFFGFDDGEMMQTAWRPPEESE